ncbi:MAG TPA: mechanosensitive ion channel protein MscS [Deltaproteobacteria bacterium]|nr:mechanosensitive ion channel protein MscS [Deltaproteobacteria bacterium]
MEWRKPIFFLALLTCFACIETTWSQEPPVSERETAPISQTSSAQEDLRIKNRLEEIFAQSPGLEKVSVKVEAGVVVLRGEVALEKYRQNALETARKVEGVVSVQDNITEISDLKKSLTPSFQKLRQRFYSILSQGPLILIAAVIVLLFWGFGRLLTQWNRLFHRMTSNPFLAEIARHLVRGFLFILGLILAFDFLDATAFLTTLLGAAGLVGLALGFAVRDVVENYVASILLSVRQPFSPNDLVVIDDLEGQVIRLTTRATILLTLDGVLLRIPNAKVFKGVIFNYTRNPLRRFDFEVTIGTDQEIAKVQAIGLKALKKMEDVARDPSPQIWVEKLGDSRIWLHVYAWVDQSQWDWFKVKSETIRRFKRAFDEAAVEMPEPIYNLNIRDRSAGPPKKGQEKLTHDEEEALNESMDLRPSLVMDKQIQQQKVMSEEPDLLDSEKPKE